MILPSLACRPLHTLARSARQVAAASQGAQHEAEEGEGCHLFIKT